MPVAGAGAARPGSGDLSARLAELAKPPVRTASRAEQAELLSVARKGPGSLLRQGNRVLVEVRFGGGGAAGLDDLRAAGAKVIHFSRRYETITAAVRPFALPRLEDLAGARSVSEVLTPLVHQAGSSEPMASAYTPCFGLATSEGDVQLRANEGRAKFELDGSGAKVGILSDSFDRDPLAPTGAGEDVASGDLPGPGNPCGHTTPVEVLEDLSDGEASDEGRAMAQIVHDLAPGAALSFATAFTGETEFANNVRALAAAGADAIVDDVSYFGEPFFQEGPVGVAVADVTADDDVAYFTAAGNNNLIDVGKDVASWEAQAFRDSEGCPSGLPSFAVHCMDFDPDAPVDRTFDLTISNKGTLRVDLQWAQPWEGVSTDLDLYLLDSADGELATSEDPNAATTQRPFEFLSWTNTTGSTQTVRIAINRCDLVCDPGKGGDSASPRVKFVLLQSNGVLDIQESLAPDVAGPSIFGHSGAEEAMSVGAIRYDTTSGPETFSSRGPVTHYFGQVKAGGPAEALISPNVLVKPDVVATDGGANTFFGSCGENGWRFFGTSAAAPHAAGVAALEREAEPAASAAAVKDAQTDTASPVGVFPEEAVGKGLVDAFEALKALVGPPSLGKEPEPTPPPSPCLPPRKPFSPLPPAPSVPPVPDVIPDTRRPQTFFRRHPPKVLRTFNRRAKVVFRFGSNEKGVTFVCRVDGALPRFCADRLVRRFPVGKHTVRVKARDAAGNVDHTAAVYRFRVKRIG